MIAIDATYLIGPLQGYLFTAVAKDANNSLVLLAFGRFHGEKSETWSKFVVQVRKAFDPHALYADRCLRFVFLCDNDKGLETISETSRDIDFAIDSIDGESLFSGNFAVDNSAF